MNLGKLFAESLDLAILCLLLPMKRYSQTLTT